MKSGKLTIVGERQMTTELCATTFRATIGNNLVPINGPSVPGIDEQLIAREDEKMARMQKHLHAQMKHPEMTAERTLMAKISLQVKARDNIHDPDVCRCLVGKQHCHLNVRSSNNGQVLTRGQSDCCVNC